MRCSSLASGLLTFAALAAARLSFEPMGHRSPIPDPRSNSGKSAYHQRRAGVNGTASTKFLNDNTSKYAVNGTSLPEVDFDIGESYSGLLPLSEDPNDPQKFFFWFFPSSGNSTEKEIVLWLSGGPGCSSLEGLVQGSGPFLWQYGTYKPVPNPWSWNRLTNVVYVEQPIGTGFSTGPITATNEDDVAKQFLGFWKNFLTLFAMQGYKVYITGESYAGYYCPYIASAMLDANNTDYYDVDGMLIYNPLISSPVVQTSVTVVPFTKYHANLMPFNESYSKQIRQQHEACGYDEYNKAFLQFPPPGPQSPMLINSSAECLNLWSDVQNQAFALNPCFNLYQVTTQCPLLWDVLGFPSSNAYTPEGASIYFDRPDVKKAIHAPVNTTWVECTEEAVFVNNEDHSDPSNVRVLPHVIDATQNVIIGHGLLDMTVIPDGTLLAIQNTTFGGKLGFQSWPSEPFYVPNHALTSIEEITAETDPTKLATMAGRGVMGTTHTERGLTYVQIDLAGHMVPQYAPSAAFRHVELLLRRVEGLNSTVPFTVGTSDKYPQAGQQVLGKGTSPRFS